MKIVFLNPRTLTTISYQRYYLMALARVWRSARVISTLCQVRILRIIWFYFRKITKNNRRAVPPGAVHTGLYEFSAKGRLLRVVIDAHDGRKLENPALIDWCDIYFKSNYWPNYDYPKKVLPIVIGNVSMTEKIVQKHVSLRESEKTIDLIFVAQVYAGIEHCVRCFEAVSQIKGKKILRAIFPRKSNLKKASRDWLDELDAARLKLEGLGVPCGDRIPQENYWRQIASSRVVFMRAGKHLCISHGMVNNLALGAVIVMDTDPFPSWPVPLQPGVNYVSLGINRPMDTTAAPVGDYECAKEIIESLIDDENRRNKISLENKIYFDKYASTTGIGEYIHDIVLKKLEDSPT